MVAACSRRHAALGFGSHFKHSRETASRPSPKFRVPPTSEVPKASGDDF